MTKISSAELQDLMASANTRVRLIGVVALDPAWEDLVPRWIDRIKRNSKFRLAMLCESDNFLFAQSFLSDTHLSSQRREFRDLRFIRDRATKDLIGTITAQHEAAKQRKPNLPVFWQIEILYLNIPISVVEVDNRIFISMTTHELLGNYEEVTDEHEWYSDIQGYLNTYFDDEQGRKYASIPGKEVLELFDHDRIPRGIYPRKSFYNTDYSQLVVWALIFDREGRLLIHRRADNANDNRSMWDKSVGGHVDFTQDVGTSRAVVREVIEELYSDELKKDFAVWAPSDEEIIYLGEWRPNRRGRHPFLEISAFEKEWVFFRLRDYQRLYSPRTMPDGTVRRLRVLADVFLFVAGTGLNEDSVSHLENSKFKLIDLSDLKSKMDRALRGEEVEDFDETPVPLFTPDLVNIMTGELREWLVEFAQYIKRYVTTR